jgi:hypothetical protein
MDKTSHGDGLVMAIGKLWLLKEHAVIDVGLACGRRDRDLVGQR